MLLYGKKVKKINRKVQGMPQSQTAASPRQQEEKKKDKNIHAQKKNKQMHEKHKDQPPSEGIRMLKQTEKRGHRAQEDFKTLSAPWYKPQSHTKLRTTSGPPP